MAYKNKIISNPVTGQDIRFLQTASDTNGCLLEMEATYHAASIKPVPHYHPFQEEDFTLLEGTLMVKLDKKITVLKAGDMLHIPKNTVHAMWNPANSKAIVNWQVRPAMNTEQLLETGMGLAQEGKVSRKGMPPFLQAALIANHFSSVYRLARPPYIVQKILFTLLAPVAYVKGYRSHYKKYLDEA